MSNKRLKVAYRKGASKLHKLVGNVLRTHPSLRSFRSYQEYPIPHTLYHVDWYILDFKLAIEIMGHQHAHPVAFDGDKQKAIINFEEQQKRDILKKELITDQGWKYLALWYREPLTEDFIADKIIKALS